MTRLKWYQFITRICLFFFGTTKIFWDFDNEPKKLLVYKSYKGKMYFIKDENIPNDGIGRNKQLMKYGL